MQTQTLAKLRAAHRGPVISPADAGYDAARITFNGMIDRRPELIARPLDREDVRVAIAHALEEDLPIAVRGGGHSVAGHCIGDGSVVVDLRLLHDVDVDPEQRTATCGGGALWEDLDPPCLRHGLATPGGTFGDTGVAGLTLGGGIGHLVGLHGLTLDNLLSATAVTASGDVVRASDEENADLFWALRGGGGNFGVVTDFTFRLHPVAQLLGGLLVYSVDDAVEVLTTWRELAANAPDELACFALISRSAVEAAEGVFVSVAYFGDPERGYEAIQPLFDCAPVLQDLLRPMYYAELQEIFGRMPFGLRNYWSGRFVRELPDEMIELTVERFRSADTFGTVLFEPLFGAAKRVTPEATAFSGREANYNVTYINSWTEAAADEQKIEVARSYSGSLTPWASGGGYINYASESAGDGMASEYGAERLARLREVKRRYDPENRFRFNHNISPD